MDKDGAKCMEVRIKIIEEVVLEKGFQYLFQIVGGEVEVKLREGIPQLNTG